MRKRTEKEVQMKTFSEIAYKPKPEFLDELLRDIRHSFVVIRNDKIFQFWITSRIEIISDAQLKVLTWLAERRHMLE